MPMLTRLEIRSALLPKRKSNTIDRVRGGGEEEEEQGYHNDRYLRLSAQIRPLFERQLIRTQASLLSPLGST